MFCPNCGLEDPGRSQFCRSCGVELNIVRRALERPDAVTASSINARDQIGKAVADRIRDLRTAGDLKKLAENVLPEIEKFLESPEERRLRNMRGGTITTAVGLGLILFFMFLSTIVRGNDYLTLIVMGGSAGIMIVLVGLAVLINARWLTAVTKSTEPSRQVSKKLLINVEKNSDLLNGPPSSESLSDLRSVTEGTTRQLK